MAHAIVRSPQRNLPPRVPQRHIAGSAIVRRWIPGTIAAYSLLAASGLFVAAAFVGALWLTGEGAVWLGHALPRPLL
jgi:hypothetical protein